MPILNMQRRGRQIGEIRIGQQITTNSGKKVPAKLESFRFTTKSPSIAQAIADLFGGTARPYELLTGEKTNEVITTMTELPVMVPPGDNVISQWYELYTKGGCQRRCDGFTEQMSQAPCVCPSDHAERNEQAAKGQACKPITRLNVMLPDLPDLGVWLISSTGFNAATELGGTAEVLSAARESGVIIPAKLRLEQRQTVKAGQTKKFAVPVLELDATLRQMTALGSGQGIASALPPPPQTMTALGTGKPPSTDMWLWITSVLDEEQRERLQAVWNKTFNFKPVQVPADQEQAVRALVESIRQHDDNEPIDAELVHDDYPSRPFT